MKALLTQKMQKLLLGLILISPFLVASQSLKNTFPQIINYRGLDAIVMSVPNMDTLNVRLDERIYFKNKLVSNKYRFDILILEIEALTYQLNYEKKRSKNLELLVLEKDVQLHLTKEERDIVKPTFWENVGDKIWNYLIGAVFGLAAGFYFM